MIRFLIPYPADRKKKSAWLSRYGMNAYYTGKHWSVRAKDSSYWHTLTWEAMAKARIPKRALEVPVEIWFRWNDGLDIDNHSSMGKMILDGMKGYLLKDDKPKYVKGVHHVYQTDVNEKKRNAIIVEIREVRDGSDGQTYQKLADKYGVSKHTMQNAIKGKTWGSVAYNLPEPPEVEE